MKGVLEERAIMLGQYIVENQCTVRATAKKFNISKSTVHKDISDRLKNINHQLYLEAKKVLEKNKKERHIEVALQLKTNIKCKK